MNKKIMLTVNIDDASITKLTDDIIANVIEFEIRKILFSKEFLDEFTEVAKTQLITDLLTAQRKKEIDNNEN